MSQLPYLTPISTDAETAVEAAPLPVRARSGFSLVEVMVATMILTFGLLAMAASTGYLSAQLRSNRFDTKRTAAKQQVIEQLRAAPWANLPTTATSYTVGQYTITATATIVNNLEANVSMSTSGPAYRAGRGTMTTVVDQMTFTIARQF